MLDVQRSGPFCSDLAGLGGDTVYLLQNTSAQPMPIEVAADQGWITVTSPELTELVGEVPAGGVVTLSVATNDQANDHTDQCHDNKHNPYAKLPATARLIWLVVGFGGHAVIIPRSRIHHENTPPARPKPLGRAGLVVAVDLATWQRLLESCNSLNSDLRVANNKIFQVF